MIMMISSKEPSPSLLGGVDVEYDHDHDINHDLDDDYDHDDHDPDDFFIGILSFPAGWDNDEVRAICGEEVWIIIMMKSVMTMMMMEWLG